jgi:rhodanese-related sulfurtransferase
MAQEPLEVAEIDAAEARALLEDGAFLLDVRELDEWAAGHAPQARHIPLGELESRYTELPDGVTIICVCRSGGRSAHAAAALSTVGYPTLNLTGGMQAWDAADLPVVSATGAGEVT